MGSRTQVSSAPHCQNTIEAKQVVDTDSFLQLPLPVLIHSHGATCTPPWEHTANFLATLSIRASSIVSAHAEDRQTVLYLLGRHRISQKTIKAKYTMHSGLAPQIYVLPSRPN